jgi:hypothetical protein
MERKRLFKILTYLIVLLFLVNYVAVRLHWYVSIWWLDMPMHFMGGIFIGLLIVWFLFPKIFKEYFPPMLSLDLVLKIVVGVLLIGVSWEFFEILVNNIFARAPFNTLDTISDIFFDLAGGTFAIFYSFFIFPKLWDGR